MRSLGNVQEKIKERPFGAPYSVKARALLLSHLDHTELPARYLREGMTFVSFLFIFPRKVFSKLVWLIYNSSTASIDWLIWSIDRFIDWLGDWSIDWLIDWLICMPCFQFYPWNFWSQLICILHDEPNSVFLLVFCRFGLPFKEMPDADTRNDKFMLFVDAVVLSATK